MNLVDMLERNAHKFARRDCLRQGDRGITYAEVARTASRAAGLLQSWGVAKGDKVAIMSLNTPAFVYAFFGGQLCGAAVVPINHKLTAPEVDYILGHCEAKVFLFDGALGPGGRKAGPCLQEGQPGHRCGRGRLLRRPLGRSAPAPAGAAEGP